MPRLRIALLTGLLALVIAGDASAAAPSYTARRVGLFKQPVYITSPRKDSRLFVVERQGKVLIVRGKKVLKTPFLDITKDVFIDNPNQGGDQRGLLSIAFAPDYAQSGLVYLFYTDHSDTVQIDEVRRDPSHPNRVDPATRRHVINAGLAGPFHHGGQLQFGPDGYLYISTGMTNTPAAPQDLGNLHGKILRINPRRSGSQPYTVPATNPFVTTPGARPEVYLYGLRNPFRFSFDRKTGDMVLGDVGEDTAEEVDYLKHGTGAGSNFGYNIFEGSVQMIPGPAPAHYVPPVISHRHPKFCASIGGYVVRDKALKGLYGRYVYNDLCRPNVRSLRLRGGKAVGDGPINLKVPYAVSFGEDAAGHLYVVGYGGAVDRVALVRPRKKKST